MGTAREPQPVKLIASLLTGRPALLETAEAALSERLGPVDFRSSLLPFEHTGYYAEELGSGLVRLVITFERLVPPAALPAIKHGTQALEAALSEEGRRRVNIDPGYVSLGKLVLASTKDHAHRLYLGEGIYGEVTLCFQKGRFHPWPWTYRDYGSQEYCALFDAIRARYKAQLREQARAPE